MNVLNCEFDRQPDGTCECSVCHRRLASPEPVNCPAKLAAMPDLLLAMRLGHEQTVKRIQQNRGAIGESSPRGPGDYLHAMILFWTREEPRPGCGCAALIKRMNAWGPDGSRQHAKHIVAHMVKEAIERGWRIAKSPAAAAIAHLAVRRACRLAEREAKRRASHAD